MKLNKVDRMPTKTRTSKLESAEPTKKNKRKISSKKRSLNVKSVQKEVDIFSAAAMENVYYIAHNAVDCLRFRGFGSSKAPKKKKKGKKHKSKH
ncbi:small lysine-rich protein 1 [Brienomyrus brachyistius]|uniref:small lysine-rich protein 1 n=1 Tax=Brienomyrus brachyistius TaxID=42636 RepID=UPI0020B31810|nr:small lysine-rich protein 1 [Brienomyrus brachyistius]